MTEEEFSKYEELKNNAMAKRLYQEKNKLIEEIISKL
jgi:hypothetical protein